METPLFGSSITGASVTQPLNDDIKQLCNEDSFPSTRIDVGNHFSTSHIFPTKGDLMCWAREIAKSLGFVITVQSADKLTSRPKPRVLLGCDRAGYYRENQRNKGWVRENKRKSTSKRCGCMFSLKGQKSAHSDEWSLEVMCGFHNHEMVHLEAHSYAGRLEPNEHAIIHEMYIAGVKPRKILTALKQKYPSNCTVLRTVYNERVRMQKEELQGGTHIQFLYKCITEHGYVSYNRISTGDCFKSNETQDSYAWALDCFKSILDQHCMPQVIVTDREIALMNAIEFLFPQTKNILCKFHISRNILAKCKKCFKNGKLWEKFLTEWHIIVESRTEIEFSDRVASMLQEYNRDYPDVCSYVLSTWLEPYKEFFVAAWVDKFLHFDNCTTNRVESGHSHLKKFLEVSVGNLTTIWKTFNHMLILQHSEIRRAFGQSIIQLNKEFSGPLYFELVGRISSSALDLITREELLAKKGFVDVSNCTHKCWNALGLPCAHDLVAYMSNANSFPLWMIHNHWKQLTLENRVTNENIKVEVVNDNEIDIEMEGILKRYKSTNTLQKQEIKKKLCDIINPSTTQTLEPTLPKALKGRSRGSYKKFKEDAKSTKRNPSLFEYVLMDEQLSQTTSTLQSKQKGVLKESRILRIVQREMPPCVSEYVSDVSDVLSDGHCGYRVVSNAMRMGTDWAKVRIELSLELQNRESMYDNIFGKERRLVLLSSLDCTVTPAPYDKWMTMPDIGLVVASCYNITFVHLSRYQSFTLLPLHSSPLASPKIVYIGFVNGNHFVQLQMRDDFSLPPTMSLWRRYREENAEHWEKFNEKDLKEN